MSTTRNDTTMTNKSYNMNKYRGYDENDSYNPPIDCRSIGDNIEYDNDPENKKDNIAIEQNHIRKGEIVSIIVKDEIFQVKLTTGHTIEVNMNNINIGVKKLFWMCQMCGFNNGYNTKQCMVLI